MPAVTRKGDTCTGHGGWPSRASSEGSPDVNANDTPVHRKDHNWDPHTNPGPPETHAGKLVGGSATVNVNGFPIGRIGDPIGTQGCGSTVAKGSEDVFAGG